MGGTGAATGGAGMAGVVALGGGATCSAGAGAGAGAAALGDAAAGAASCAGRDDAIREISASNGDLGPGCSETATNLVRTSSAAESDAAEVCARSIGGSALAGLLLPQAATTSATA